MPTIEASACGEDATEDELRAENAKIQRKLEIAELKAENAELRLKDLKRKISELEFIEKRLSAQQGTQEAAVAMFPVPGVGDNGSGAISQGRGRGKGKGCGKGKGWGKGTSD